MTQKIGLSIVALLVSLCLGLSLIALIGALVIVF
jgi:hypothetical protein